MKFERYGLGIIKGMTVTIRHLLRHPTVNQYPEQRLNVSRRIRGNELIWSRDELHRLRHLRQGLPAGRYRDRDRHQPGGQ